MFAILPNGELVAGCILSDHLRLIKDADEAERVRITYDECVSWFIPVQGAKVLADDCYLMEPEPFPRPCAVCDNAKATHPVEDYMCVYCRYAEMRAA